MIEFDKIPDDHVSVHPGLVLLQDFIKPMQLQRKDLARELGLTCKDLDAILDGRRNVDGAIALMLAIRFGTSVDFWLNLQATHEISNHLLKNQSLWKRLRESNVPGANLIPEVESASIPFAQTPLAREIEATIHGGSMLRIDLFKASMPQRRLAQTLGLKPSQVSRMISGKRPISLEEARSLAKVFKRQVKRYLKKPAQAPYPA